MSEEKDTHEFKPGDVVRLNSGSPNLTVGNITEHGQVSVNWVVDGEVRHAFFLPQMLTLQR